MERGGRVVVQLGERVPPSDLPNVSLGHPSDVSVVLLGGFELRLDGHPVPLPSTARRLLVFLALAHRPLARAYVSQSLWLEATERHADGNLRSALWKIGKLGAPAIDMSGGQVCIGAHVNVDFWDSLALARSLLNESRSVEDLLLDERAFTQDLLPDWYEEWVVAERERYRQLRLHALEDLCLELVARRRFGLAVQAGLAAVAGEPLRESATEVLMRSYLAEGNAGEAIRHYWWFQRLLWNELRVRPSPAMEALIEDVRLTND